MDFPSAFVALEITDAAFQPALTVRAADLTDFTQPKDVNGGALALTPTDVAVDPQLGRFVLDLAALNVQAEDVRVDYLIGPSHNMTDGKPSALSTTVPEVFAFLADGRVLGLRDAFDGTLVTTKLRFGLALTDFHGADRGWRIYRNGVEASATLPAEAKALDDVTTPVSPGHIAIDVERGRFKFPAGFLAPEDEVTVDFSAEETLGEEQILNSLIQRLPRSLPAGVVPVVIDTRRMPVNPANLR